MVFRVFRVLGVQGVYGDGCSGCLGFRVCRVLGVQGAGCSGCSGCWVFMVCRLLGIQGAFLLPQMKGLKDVSLHLWIIPKPLSDVGVVAVSNGPVSIPSCRYVNLCLAPGCKLHPGMYMMPSVCA